VQRDPLMQSVLSHDAKCNHPPKAVSMLRDVISHHPTPMLVCRKTKIARGQRLPTMPAWAWYVTKRDYWLSRRRSFPNRFARQERRRLADTQRHSSSATKCRNSELAQPGQAMHSSAVA